MGGFLQPIDRVAEGGSGNVLRNIFCLGRGGLIGNSSP